MRIENKITDAQYNDALTFNLKALLQKPKQKHILHTPFDVEVEITQQMPF